MPLADVQRALAHAFTNADVRETLRRDPTAFARTFDLSRPELQAIAAIGERHMRGYTNSLDRKRANECARFLPASAHYIGERFRRDFLRFARRTPLGEGSRRYRNDAVAFARYLLRLRGDDALDARARALLSYEASPSIHIGLYAYRMPELMARPTLVLRFAGREIRL